MSEKKMCGVPLGFSGYLAVYCDLAKGHDNGKHEPIPAAPAQEPPKVEETKYLKLLRWFKLFYDFYQKDVAGKPSACASALAEDGELQEFIREANRIG